MDNYYIRHILGNKLKEVSDNECRVIVTVKFANVDGTNRIGIKEGIKALENKERGSWCIIPAFNCVKDIDKLKRQHTNAMKHVPKKEKTPFEYPRS